MPGPPAGPPPQAPAGFQAPGGNPYGHPGHPGQPGPYGAPQAPYGVPPQAPYGYPGPGMPPPVPPRHGAGKVWALIGAVAGVVVLGGIAAAVAFSGGGGPAGPKYRVTVPQTLADGRYTLAKDISAQASSSVPHDGANEHGIQSVGGQYANGTKSLVMVGIYGTIDDPRTTVAHSISGMKSTPDTHVAVPEKEFTPSGGGAPLTCGVDVREEMGQKVTLEFCVWADSSTSGNVAETDADDLAKDPQSVDLQAFADTVGKIRSEARKPVG